MGAKDREWACESPAAAGAELECVKREGMMVGGEIRMKKRTVMVMLGKGGGRGRNTSAGLRMWVRAWVRGGPSRCLPCTIAEKSCRTLSYLPLLCRTCHYRRTYRSLNPSPSPSSQLVRQVSAVACVCVHTCYSLLPPPSDTSCAVFPFGPEVASLLLSALFVLDVFAASAHLHRHATTRRTTSTSVASPPFERVSSSSLHTYIHAHKHHSPCPSRSLALD